MTNQLQPGTQPEVAGLQGPDDIDRQTAALLRQALEDSHDKIEEDPIVDDATITRVMNTLRAEGLFDHPAGQRPAAVSAGPAPMAPAVVAPPPAAGRSHSLPSRQPGWLWAVAVLVAAVGAWMATGTGTPGAPAGAPKFVEKGVANSAVQSVQVNAPDPEAARLVQLLATLGVRAEVQAVGDARLVRAQVPAASLAAVGSALAQQGLVSPHDGRLAVLFEARKP